MKASRAADAKQLQDIPNIGPRMTEDFHRLGIRTPQDLKNKDAYTLYQKMSRLAGRQDPCVLDTYMAAIDFMNGAPARPWYAYTTARKRQYPELNKSFQ